MNLDLSNYLSGYNKNDSDSDNFNGDRSDAYPYNFNEDNLKNKLKKDMEIYGGDISLFQNYIINYYNKYIKNKKINDKEHFECFFDYEIFIDIFSPFLEFLGKNELFKILFIVPINFKFIEKHNLEKIYIEFFKKNYYPSLRFDFNNTKDIDCLKKFNINFQSIEKLSIFTRGEIKSQNFLDIYNIFNFNDIKNNLTYLTIDSKKEIKLSPFVKFNDYNKLLCLVLNNICFENKFTVNIKNLQFLILENCKNITITQECSNKIKVFKIDGTDINIGGNELKFPEIERFYFCYLEDSLTKFNIDLKSMVKIKDLFIDLEGFLFLDSYQNLSIEKLTLYSREFDYNSELFEDVFGKLFLLKKLKKLSISAATIDDKKISLISGKNVSLEELEIIWLSDGENILYNLQEKFPNISYLNSREIMNNEDLDTSLIIKENKNSKIKKLNIEAHERNNYLYINSFENTEEVELSFNRYIHEENGFPIFDEKCNHIFKSLKNLFLKFKENIEFELLDNLFKNLDKMPNLKKFKLEAVCECIEQKQYEEYIGKILSLELRAIKLNIQKEKLSGKEQYYTVSEITNIRKINLRKFDEILISKIC